MINKSSFLWIGVALLGTGCLSAKIRPVSPELSIRKEGPMYPLAKQVKSETILHGNLRNDPYAWLRQKKSPETLGYLKNENTYTQEVMKPTEGFQVKLYEEMLGRIVEDDATVPYRYGEYEYYNRTVEGKAYTIYCRKKLTPEGQEEIILDLNEFGAKHKYVSLGAFAVSPNHQLLAFSIDTSGYERHDLRIKDLKTGEYFEEVVPNTYYSLAWGDDQTLFYDTVDQANRPYRVHRHRLNTSPDKDSVILEEKDDRFFVTLERSRSGEFVLISSDSAITSEVRVIATKTPEMKPRLVVPRVQGVEYSVEHHGEHFYVLTNENATNFKLIRMSQYATTLDEGEVILAEDQEITRNRVSAFEKFLVIYQRHEGLPQLEIRPLDKFESPRVVEFDDASYSVWLGTNPEFFTDSFRYGYTSFVQPSATYEINLTTFDRKLLKEKPVRDFDPSLYGTKRVMATASDGVKVPVSMVYRKGIDLHGDNPMVLYGYGAYGSSYDAYFSSNWISLLNRGVMIGIAHIRGGGEFGRRWKNDGKLKKKMNTFTDFIACAEHLIEKGYTSSSKLVIQGESAGGLLIGAVLNMRPKLFKAAVAGVPFVDVVNTMLDETIPLTAIEWEEWGNPNNIEDYETILRYSPYDNVSVKDYPAILVLAGLNDPRVHYWEPAKWTAKLRAHKTDQNVLLLKTNMGAGHGGASGRYGRLKEQAFEFTFMLKELDLLKVGASS